MNFPLLRPLLGWLLFAALPLMGEGDAPMLESARAVRALLPAQAGEGRLVKLSGVVLAAQPQGNSLVLSDGTDSIYVMGPDEAIDATARGDEIEVRGHTVAGSYAPFVVADSVRKTGVAPIPEPRRVGAEDLFARGLDSQWIVVSGVVRSFNQSDRSRFGTGVLASPWDSRFPPKSKNARIEILTLALGDRLLPVKFNEPLDPEILVDAEVEIRGLCFNSHNVDGQFLGPVLDIPRDVPIKILRPPPGGPFSLPTVPSRSLFQFRPEGLSLHRVHIDGVVLHRTVGSGIWIRDDGHGLFVRADPREPLVPGDRVQVAGFPEHEEFSPILADAVYRKSGHGEVPRPVPLVQPGDEAFHNNDLVVVEGTVLDRRVWPRGPLMRVRALGQVIEAACDNENVKWDGAKLEVGSVLSITGLCVLTSEHPIPQSGKRVPDSFRLLVRSPEDLTVLRAAPWWTLQRLAIVLAGIVAALSIGLVVVFVVSRKRIAAERALRALEISTYSARLAERNRMARDLHDTLAQGLTAILLQLEVASKPDASLGDVSTHVGVALNLVRSSMMEVRSFIRNLRTQTQQDVALASALADVLRTAVDGGDLRAPFRIEGKERKLATNVEAQIIRVTQEAVLNAIQHSGATEISLVLEYAEKNLTVCVSDNGHGFEQTAASQKRLHFGLVGMRERAGLIGAELSIETSPGKGTRVALSVPYHAVLLDKVL